MEAIIKEAMRIHHAVGLGLERNVPSSGLTLPDGTHFGWGTIVGMNEWVVHRNGVIYGANVDVFDPLRWLQHDSESVEEYKKRMTNMERANLVFGHGSRTCIGKNISLLEVYKVIPTLFACFNMELVNPDKDWKSKNSWFVRQSDMDIRLRRRENVSLRVP
jgi:cytochrome P450